MWNKKAIKIAISTIIGSVVICGSIIYKINDNMQYTNTGKTFMLELEERAEYEDITYQEKINLLMTTLNEVTDDNGIDVINLKKANGKKEKLSLTKKTREFNLFREGMIDGMISETDKHIENGIAVMFENDNEESEFYNEFEEKAIEKYDERYIETMIEYKNVLLEVKKDFKDGKLKYTYTKEFEDVDKKYKDLMKDYAGFAMEFIWDSMWNY